MRNARPSQIGPDSRPPGAPARFVLGRGAAIGLAGALAVTTIWAGAATWFVLSRDDLAQRVFARDAEIRYGYEDRLKRLRDELERNVTQSMVERTGVAARVEGLAKKQAEIEQRQTWLRTLAARLPGLGDASTLASGRTPSPRLPATASAFVEQTPQALPEPFALRLHDPEPASAQPAPPRDRLSRLENALNDISAEEIGMIDGLRHKAEEHLAQLRAAVGATGLDPDRGSGRGVGGPLVPLPPAAPGGAFGPLAAELGATFDELERTLAVAKSLPLARPLAGEMEMTSPFGYRIDPFTRGAALHTGADYRAEAGAPVHATAAGKVTNADYTGGYGNMVEIDHGGGVVTRYGHLSGYAVSPGERVEAGAVIGYAGSTGRSTGSHLHYETRINGEPVNPVRFLEAGTRVAALLAETR